MGMLKFNFTKKHFFQLSFYFKTPLAVGAGVVAAVVAAAVDTVAAVSVSVVAAAAVVAISVVVGVAAAVVAAGVSSFENNLTRVLNFIPAAGTRSTIRYFWSDKFNLTTTIHQQLLQQERQQRQQRPSDQQWQHR